MNPLDTLQLLNSLVVEQVEVDSSASAGWGMPTREPAFSKTGCAIPTVWRYRRPERLAIVSALHQIEPDYQNLYVKSNSLR